jgi:predicted dehydrogenase
MNFAIIGCGLIGQKRARALPPGHAVVAAADINADRARSLASQFPGSVATTDWKEAIQLALVDAVVVATTNEWLATVTQAAVSLGKNVLVEKPAARTTDELRAVLAAAESSGSYVQAGFNHRYHPGLQKARAIFETGELGPMMFVRGRYGHGGRIGYDREWRADPAISGGGELLDQGVHLIDLARWFLGEFSLVDGHAATYYWDMPVDDNAFLSLRTKDGQTAWLQASCTEWKNMFSFEIYGRNGKLQVDGLGGSYGVERVSYYRMRPGMGPPETTIWEYPGEDTSFRLELSTFVDAITGVGRRGPGLGDALKALEIVETIYRSSKK